MAGSRPTHDPPLQLPPAWPTWVYPWSALAVAGCAMLSPQTQTAMYPPTDQQPLAPGAVNNDPFQVSPHVSGVASASSPPRDDPWRARQTEPTPAPPAKSIPPDTSPIPQARKQPASNESSTEGESKSVVAGKPPASTTHPPTDAAASPGSVADADRPPGPVAAEPTGLKLTVEAPGRCQVGGFAVFRVAVRNGSGSPLEDVLVKCEFDEALTCPGKHGKSVQRAVKQLAAGAEELIPLSLQSDIQGHHTVRFSLSLGPDDNKRVVDSQVVTVEFLPRRVDVQITGPEQRTVGSRAEYTLLVRNISDEPLTDVVVDLRHDAAVAVREVSSEVRPSSSGVVWKLGTVGPQQVVPLQVEFDCRTMAHRACIAVNVSGGNVATESVEACLQIVPLAGLLDVRVNDIDDPLEVGSRGRYEITVQNIGLQSVRDIVLAIEITPELTLLSGGVDLGLQALETKASLEETRRGMVFETIPELAPDAMLVYVIRVEGAGRGTGELTARVTSSANRQPIVTVEPTEVIDPRDDAACFQPRSGR